MSFFLKNISFLIVKKLYVIFLCLQKLSIWSSDQHFAFSVLKSDLVVVMVVYVPVWVIWGKVTFLSSILWSMSWNKEGQVEKGLLPQLPPFLHNPRNQPSNAHLGRSKTNVWYIQFKRRPEYCVICGFLKQVSNILSALCCLDHDVTIVGNLYTFLNETSKYLM
jgi:hypothetical protein